MTDDEKMEAVDTLMALYGGWLTMSSALLGYEGADDDNKWRRYHTLRVERAELLGIPDRDQKHEYWDRLWKPAFWDVIIADRQEET